MIKNTPRTTLMNDKKADNTGLASSIISRGLAYIEDKAPELIDDSAASDSTIYSSAKIYSLLPEKTASGAVVAFSDGIEELPIVEGIFNIDPDVDGNTEVVINVNNDTITVDLGNIIYGGTINITTGEGAITWIKHIIDGSENWSNVGGDYPQAFRLNNAFSGIKTAGTGVQNIMSDKYPWISSSSADYGTRMQNNGTALFIYDENFSNDLPGFLASLEETPVTYIYELATAQNFTIDPIVIKTAAGVGTTNSISCDTGDSSVTYKTYIY